MAETPAMMNGVTSPNGVPAPAAALKERLRSGLAGEASVLVDETNTAIALGSGFAARAQAFHDLAAGAAVLGLKPQPSATAHSQQRGLRAWHT